MDAEKRSRFVSDFAIAFGAAAALCALLAALGSGCGTLPTQSSNQPSDQLEAGKEYRLDLELTVNGVQGRGMIVVPEAQSYQIRASAPGSVDLVTVHSCHRENTLTKQDDNFRMTVAPTQVEKGRPHCPFRISAYSPKFRYVGAYIDFANMNLQGRIICNGEARSSATVTVCGSKAETIQEIAFDLETTGITTGASCIPPTRIPALDPSSKGSRWEVRLGRGFCSYLFYTPDKKFTHRLTTHGYDEYPLPR